MRLRPLLSGAAVAIAMVAVMALGSADSAHAATTFNPTLQVTLKDPTAGKPSDISSALVIPDGDVNFAAFIAYIPEQWGVVTGDNIPIGTHVGTLDATAVLGLANSACNQVLPVSYDFMNGSLDITDTVSFQDTDKNKTVDYADDNDGNGFYDAVDKYPEWLNRIFTDDGTATGNPMTPIRRSIGVTLVAGIPVILQFLIFPPGTSIDPAIPSDKSLGFPSVTVLQNIGDTSTVPAPSIINDFCTPLSTSNISAGEAEGTKLLVNPGDGTYKFGTFALGQRDADGDSFENSLDTCALVANVGNPRVTGDGDVDSDGLDQACDPNSDATTGVNSDQDLDGYQNRQDNCPLTANGQEQDNQKDDDMDTVGNACDPAPTDANAQGTYSVATPSSEIVIGAGGAGPGTKAVCAGCYDANATQAPSSTGGATKTTAPSSGSPTVTAAPSIKDDGGTSTGTIIAIVAGVAAAVAIVGGGAYLLMRRRGA